MNELHCREAPPATTLDPQLEAGITFFERTWRGRKPFAKLFTTEFGNYLYDPGTNKLFRCEEAAYAVVEALQSTDVRSAVASLREQFARDALVRGMQEIIDKMGQERILLADPAAIHFDSLHFSRLEQELADNLGQVILEVTEECNLSCSYCVYNDIVGESRNHGSRRMAPDIARKAIDHIVAHSARQALPSVTFYGGEPLLRFQFIQECVEYCRNSFGGRQVDFAVTTNGTTITSPIASFLAREQFSVTVSVDGPQEVHDLYRVFPDGTGTFASAMAGLQVLVDAYGDQADKKINLSMVYAPPFSSRRLNRIADLWREYPWLGKIRAGITYPHDGSIPAGTLSDKDLIEDKSLTQWGVDRYFEKYIRGEEVDPLVKTYVDRLLVRVFSRPLFDMPITSIHLNGCCVPGGRKIHVTVDGHLAVCERVHTLAPYIGHVDTGIDLALVKEVFVNSYGEKSLARCASCWAQRFCGLCYADAFSGHKYDDTRKSFVCEGVVKTTEKQLKLYSKLIHVNPEGLNYLADMVIM